jgi:hydrogenase maturation protease
MRPERLLRSTLLTEKQIRHETTLILGVGNIIMADEGFGIHVAHHLKKMQLPDNVIVEEGGVGGFNLLGSLEGVKRLIVLDVMTTGVPAGEIHFFKPDPSFGEPGKSIISFHQVGVLELIQMWGLLGYKPEIYFLVTRPVVLKWSTELSPLVQVAALKATQSIREMFVDDFVHLERSYSLCTS